MRPAYDELDQASAALNLDEGYPEVRRLLLLTMVLLSLWFSDVRAPLASGELRPRRPLDDDRDAPGRATGTPLLAFPLNARRSLRPAPPLAGPMRARRR